ncbi:MAG TPA: hypothetical protein VGE98_16075, partial [Thermoanaerobaculia bacterium]
IWELLKPGGRLIATVPVGQSKLASWYRQYSAADLERLFCGWIHRIRSWGYDGVTYTPIAADELDGYDYRDRHDGEAGAGGVAGIVALRPS